MPGRALVDVELETVESTPAALESFQGKALRVLSYHNFDRTPALKAVVRRLRKFPAEIYKIATHASRQSDNLKLLALLTEDAPLVLLGMSEAGTTTRLLAPSKGAVFTFAAPNAIANQVGKAGKGSQRGADRAGAIHGFDTASVVSSSASQPRHRNLWTYRENRSDTRCRRLCTIARSKLNVSTRSICQFLVEPGHIRDFFKCVAELPIAGLSVTIPHKQKVMRYLDYVDPLACGIGAVNTIYRKRGKLCGTNTDAIGVTAPLAKNVKLNRSRVLVVGNGGAARAAVFALKDQGSEVVVTGRNPERVKRLARAAGVSAIEFAKLDGDYFDVLIQTTPRGPIPEAGRQSLPKTYPCRRCIRHGVQPT